MLLPNGASDVMSITISRALAWAEKQQAAAPWEG
jgi:hypothetical protein